MCVYKFLHAVGCVWCTCRLVKLLVLCRWLPQSYYVCLPSYCGWVMCSSSLWVMHNSTSVRSYKLDEVRCITWVHCACTCTCVGMGARGVQALVLPFCPEQEGSKTGSGEGFWSCWFCVWNVYGLFCPSSMGLPFLAMRLSSANAQFFKNASMTCSTAGSSALSLNSLPPFSSLLLLASPPAFQTRTPHSLPRPRPPSRRRRSSITTTVHLVQSCTEWSLSLIWVGRYHRGSSLVCCVCLQSGQGAFCGMSWLRYEHGWL